MRIYSGQPTNRPTRVRIKGRWVLTLLAAAVLDLAFNFYPALGENYGIMKIYVSADKLIADNDAQTAEFIGNVSLKRGNGILNAGRLIIYFEPKTGNKKVEADRKEMVKKFIASDNVRIKTDQITARAQQAVYVRTNRTIVLSGPDTRVTKGNNSLAGSTITLYIDTEDVQVAGGSEQRVEAVFGPPSEAP